MTARRERHRGDDAIAAVARTQHGVWSRRQALRAGITPTMILTRVRNGLWIPQDTAVYAHAAAPATWHRSVMSAVLAEPSAVASHRTAAVLHGLDGFRPGRPEITVPPGANARGRLAVVHRGIDVDTTTVDRIPCVSPAQLFIDLAQITSASRLRGALGQAAASSPTLLSAVRDRYCALAPRGGRNLRSLRAALEVLGDEVPLESELERHLRRVLTWPGIPRIEWQASFPGRRAGQQRVDGLIRAWKVVVEGDGRAWHTRVDDFDQDRRRDAEAAAAGFLTLRFTWHQLTAEPDWVREIVLNTGGQREIA